MTEYKVKDRIAFADISEYCVAHSRAFYGMTVINQLLCYVASYFRHIIFMNKHAPCGFCSATPTASDFAAG